MHRIAVILGTAAGLTGALYVAPRVVGLVGVKDDPDRFFDASLAVVVAVLTVGAVVGAGIGGAVVKRG